MTTLEISSVTAHEISNNMRTPMNGILGVARLSREERDPDILLENIEKMEASGQYLLGLINDTLDFQKMKGGRLELHTAVVDVRAMVQDIASMVSETAKEKKLQFSVKGMAEEHADYIYADAMRLRQIFVNLLSNAVKFTPDGGSIGWIIEKSLSNGNTSHYVFTIQDTGVGMSEKFVRQSMFKPFAQEYNLTTTQYSGTGLGLSIVKNLVEQMGGRIEVESQKDVGTTFRVYLAFERAQAPQNRKADVAAPASGETEKEKLEGVKILLAEDHPLNAEIARKLLEKWGCVVDWMDNGEKAVKAFEHSKENTFAVILMDIRMPVMDGLAAAKKIRACNRRDAKTIPIIAMTANAYEEDRKKTYEAGMNGHLTKPIEPDILYRTLLQFTGK